MKLSIITVNLNNKIGLDLTFNSIREQSYQDFEFIVIDGNSTDTSINIIRSNARINQWISEDDTGVYDAMNKGISLAHGEYLLFLNSGDYLKDPNTLELLIPKLQQYDIIYGDLIFSKADNDQVYHYPDILTFDFLFTKSLGHPASFIKKSLFENFGLYETKHKIIADWVFFIKTIVNQQATTLHVHQIIAVFDTNGMSSVPAIQRKIADERDKLLQQEFSLFYSNYRKLHEIKNQLKRIQSAKGFKWLKALGVKKFQ